MGSRRPVVISLTPDELKQLGQGSLNEHVENAIQILMFDAFSGIDPDEMGLQTVESEVSGALLDDLYGLTGHDLVSLATRQYCRYLKRQNKRGGMI